MMDESSSDSQKPGSSVSTSQQLRELSVSCWPLRDSLASILGLASLVMVATGILLFTRQPWMSLFVLLVLVFWNSARGGVPLYLSNPRTRAALAALLPQEAGNGETSTGTKQKEAGSGETATESKNKNKPGVRFADLGCGLGGPVLDLARRRPDGHFTGIESAPLPFALAWLRLRFAGLANVKLLFGNYRSHGLGEYDVVYAFLSPVPMPDLFDQAKQEMKSGSLLISNTFDVPGHPADETVEVADRRQTSLYLWRL